MNSSFKRSSLVTLIALCGLAVVAPSCASSSDDNSSPPNNSSGSPGSSGASSTPSGGASAAGSTSAAGSAALAGNGGAASGNAGNSGATAGGSANAGSGGTSAGAGGAIAGSGGASAGAGGAAAGSGGANAGSGGASAGAGGAIAGSGGASAGAGGAAAGAGGASAGAGGAAAGAGGASAGAGGATAGAGGASAGAGGTGGASPCGGCAVLTAPLAASGDHTVAQIYFAATDLTSVTVTVRACVVSGNANSYLQSYVQDGATAYNGDYATSLYTSFSQIMSCSAGLQNLTYSVVVDGSFDPTVVTSLTLQILTNGTAGPFVQSVVYVDSITTTGNKLGPYTFDANAQPLTLLTSGTVAGSTLGWLQ